MSVAHNHISEAVNTHELNFDIVSTLLAGRHPGHAPFGIRIPKDTIVEIFPKGL
jgi:hypothetical protein